MPNVGASATAGAIKITYIDPKQIAQLRTNTAHNISLQECQKICAEIMAKGMPNTSFAVHDSQAEVEVAQGRGS
jgi:hypothetical protein